ncbi:MAG TPA: ornithine cyclodeaminase family protein [Solirubrobacteraceae bacterium]|nr:ornithine cyclodeaminase family protein [Solirubrobacteraceae bacterium]
MHEIVYLSGPDVEALALSDDEILRAVRETLRAQGRAETVIEPRVHLFPRDAAGHFNVLRGVTPRFAGVKVVGDYLDNHRLGLPSELALLLLMDPATGMPKAIVDATAITEMRTGAVTAIGAEHLARRDARVLGHIGARGTAYWNVRLLARVLPELREVRVHSRRAESREAFAQRLRRDLPGLEVISVEDWESCVRGADVVVEASRLTEPAPLLRTAWIAPGALVVPYGTVSAVELDLTDVMDKIVLDDWGQAGSGPLGALRAHVDSGRLTADNLHAELGQIVAGARPGREHPHETILFWHRGLSITDVALGQAMLAKANDPTRPPIGTRLPYRA